MTAITICSDFGGQEKSLSLFPLFPHHFAWSDGSRCHNLSIFECWVLSQLFTLLLHFPQEDLQFLFTFCHKGGVICISEIIDIFPAILIPACASSSSAFCMMYSAYKLNKQGDNIHSLDVLLSWFGTSMLFHVLLLLLDQPRILHNVLCI